MNITEARVILADANSTFTQKYEAVRVLTQSSETTIRELVACLEFGGICAEMAAMRLHLLTGRERPEGEIGVCLAPSDWAAFIEDAEGRDE